MGTLFPEPAHDETERQLDLLEAAWADFVHSVRTGVRYRRADPRIESVRMRGLFEVRAQFDVYRKRYATEDDPLALLYAVQLAMEEVVPVPYWVADAFVGRLRRMTALEADTPMSLHDAFDLGSVIPTTPKRWAAARRALRLTRVVWHEASRLMHREKLGLVPALRQVVKEQRLHIGLTTARKLFLKQDDLQLLHLGKRPRRRGQA